MRSRRQQGRASPRLKRVAIDRLREGMFIHALDGDWLQHNVWRSRFKLEDAGALQALQRSGAPACWIDLDRGLDEAPPPAAALAGDTPAAPGDVPADTLADPPAPPATPAQAAHPPAVPRAATPAAAAPAPLIGRRAVPPPTHSLADELTQAAAVCQRAREVVSDLVNEARLGRALAVDRCQPLVQEVTDSVMRNPGALVSLARLKTADDYSYMHSVAVCALMVALARQLGLDEATTRAAGFAGLLHDLGKAAVPLAVLNKPGRLDPSEWTLIRQHPVLGHRLLLGAAGGGREGGPALDTALEAALDVCLHHHERMDGNGYPHGLAGEDISLLARMGAVCDVYDAITSHRPYKQGWDPAESVSRMAAWVGQFDPQVFQHFVRSLGIYPVGALVRLASGRLAVVAEQNPARLTRPQVRVFHDAVRDRPLPPRLIDLAASDDDHITDREPARRAEFPQIDALWADPAVLRAARPQPR